MKSSVRLAGVLSISIFSSFLAAQALAGTSTLSCVDMFTDEPIPGVALDVNETSAKAEERAVESAPKVVKDRAQILKKWQKLNANGAFEKIANDGDVTRLLNDLDLHTFGDRLEEILDRVIATKAPVTAELFFNELAFVLKDEGLPQLLIDVGIRDVKPGDLTSFYRLMGSLTFAETRRMYIGSEQGLKVTKGSLLGRYLEETGAKMRVLKLKNVVTGKMFTEDRLVVSVSAASFPAWQKYFSQPTMMSVFGHANVYTNGTVYTHMGGPGSKGQLRAMTENTPLPILLLKPSEAVRLQRYMELSALQKYTYWTHALKQPWTLDGYTARGEYSCCTHWIGNLPIGDALVPSYSLPGGKKVLKQWNSAQHEDLKLVWKVPGNEQLASVIGQLDKNVAGEFASPGYVIQTLFGPTTNERVPIVFIFANDHKADIPVNPQLRFERPH